MKKKKFARKCNIFVLIYSGSSGRPRTEERVDKGTSSINWGNGEPLGEKTKSRICFVGGLRNGVWGSLDFSDDSILIKPTAITRFYEV